MICGATHRRTRRMTHDHWKHISKQEKQLKNIVVIWTPKWCTLMFLSSGLVNMQVCHFSIIVPVKYATHPWTWYSIENIIMLFMGGHDSFTAQLSYCTDVIMSAMASQITSITIVYSTVYSGVDQRNHQSSASLAFVRGIHRSPVHSPHKGPVTRKMFSSDDVIMSFT